MPPKRSNLNKTLTKSIKKPTSTRNLSATESEKNAISSMFKRIESSDSTLKECKFCNEKIKSCLFKDHLDTKCINRVGRIKTESSQSDDVIFLNATNNLNIIPKKLNNTERLNQSFNKKLLSQQQQISPIKPTIKIEKDFYQIGITTPSPVRILNKFNQTESSPLPLPLMVTPKIERKPPNEIIQLSVSILNKQESLFKKNIQNESFSPPHKKINTLPCRLKENQNICLKIKNEINDLSTSIVKSSNLLTEKCTKVENKNHSNSSELIEIDKILEIINQNSLTDNNDDGEDIIINQSNLSSPPQSESISKKLKPDTSQDPIRPPIDSNDSNVKTNVKSQSTTKISEQINQIDQNENDDDLLNQFLDNNDLSTQSNRVVSQVTVVDSETNMIDKNNESSLNSSATNNNTEFDFYLNNFINAVKSVVNEDTFSCLLNDFDYEIIKKFSLLSHSSKILYVRLFQRKYKWLNMENINYERISSDLKPNLDELLNNSFLIDESSIDSYEEIIYLLKLSQLKELAKVCHVINLAQTVKLRSEFIKLILQHFKTQKSLQFHFKSKEKLNNSDGINSRPLPVDSTKSQFMNQCRKILGKCFKLDKLVRSVFVRILMLFSLSSTCHVDPKKNDSGQQNLLQILMINMGKIRYMDYEVRLTIKIFDDRDALLRYQDALEFEYELLNIIESKDYEQAFELFDKKIYEFKKIILNPDLNEYDLKLPNYLRVFTSGSTYSKIISIYAFEVLQRLKKYNEANELYEFLLFKQNTYLLTYRAKWFERLALNYETHLKNPIKSFEILSIGLKDKQYVRKAGRLALYQRLVKMSQVKKYSKINNLKDKLKNLCITEKYEYREAPTIEIEGTLLHAEFIPGRKNVFIQNFEYNLFDEEEQVEVEREREKEKEKLEEQKLINEELNNDNQESMLLATQLTIESAYTQSSKMTKQSSSDILVKNSYNLSVEQVALTHYIKNLDFTNGKHAETSIITTIYGMLFWNVIFDKSVNNVFVDKFQSTPLDLQTDYFYLNRKDSIDARLELLHNAPIEFICELISECWSLYKDVQCSLVSWSLFETIDDLLSLIKCFKSNQLAELCKYISMNYRYCRSGGPDLILWSTKTNKLKFVEVKGPGDRLSYKQIVWLDFFIRNSIDCEVCYVKGQSSKRLREFD